MIIKFFQAIFFLIKKDQNMNFNLFKTKTLTLLTAIMLVVGLGLVYGFTSHDQNGQKPNVAEKLKTAPANGWYAITITNPAAPENTANQQIGMLVSAPPATDPLGCAQNNSSGDRCAVFLSFNPSATTVPLTVAAADSNPLVDVGEDARHPEDE